MLCCKRYLVFHVWLVEEMTRKLYTSPNFNERGGDGSVSPHMVILHYTGMETAQAALERLCDPAAEVSAHYLIEEDGFVHALVPEEKRAWHAGLSFWQGIADINSASVGIELVNRGHEFGYTDFPAAQMAALKLLLSDIVAKYDIKPQYILAHSDITPERKQDPGEKFDWQTLAAAGFGLWSDPQEMDFDAVADILSNPDTFIDLLGGYGYDASVAPETLISAYHRHFCPDKFADGDNPQEPGISSIARLLSLIRQAHENA